MRITVTLTFDAPPAAVAAMLVDPGFQADLCAATGDPEAQVQVTERDGEVSVRTARRLPTADFPPAFAALVGESVTATQTTVWQPAAADGPRRADVTVVIEGTPVRLAATGQIAPEGRGTTLTYDGELTAAVPLVGRKVEKAAEPAVRSALEKEQRVGAQWLAAVR